MLLLGLGPARGPGAESAVGPTVPASAPLVEPASTGSVDLADLSLDQLIQLKVGTVYGDARQWKSVADVPSQVTIVTSEEIKLYGYKTLADILRSVPGLYVTYDRNYSYLGVRGFNRGDSNTRVLVMIDGHRINDSVQDAALLGNDFPLDIDLFDRVEIMQGPGSSIYGNNAFFGVINVISKTGQHYQGGEVSCEIRSFDTYKARFSFGQEFKNGVEFLVSGTYYDSEGPDSLFFREFNSPSSNNGYAVGVDGEQLYSLFGSISWRGLSFEAGYIDREKTVPTASYSTVFNSSTNRTYDYRGYADLKFDHTFRNDLNLVARLYYDYSGYHGDYLYDVAPSPPPALIVNKDQFRADMWGALAQVVKQYGDDYTLTAGTEFRSQFSQQLRNFNVGQPAVLDIEQSAWDVGVYAQGEVRVSTNASFNLGVRYDYFDTFGDTINPRAACIFKPLSATAIKLLLGSSYLAPNVSERYYNDGGLSTKSNPNLDAETIRTYQLVLDQRLPGGRATEDRGVLLPDRRPDHLSTRSGRRVVALRQSRRGRSRRRANPVATKLGGELAPGSALQLPERFRLRDRRLAEQFPRNLVGAHAAVPILRDRICAGVEFQFSSAAQTLAGTEAEAF